MEKRLYKSMNDRVIGGVCGGIAEYFAVDSVIVRLIWVVFTLMIGAGLIAYIIAAIIVPENPARRAAGDLYERHGGSSDSESYGSHEGSGGPYHQDRNKNTSIVLGAGLILVGGFVLVRDFIPWIPRDFILAAILIGAGFFFIVRRR